MNTYHIHINGIVQGVGFRPKIYNLAKEMDISGKVKNDSDGVHILFNADEEIAALFLKRIQQEAPAQSKIILAHFHKITDTFFQGFSILVEDGRLTEKKVLISPDAGMCVDCRNELNDKNNRRFRYPFITCAQCGPRCSIINELPYERHGTSMEKFLMCENCTEEYTNFSDRRFFSQTNSCPQCGIRLSIHDTASSTLPADPEMVLSRINEFLTKGKIIAVKGIGGYLLLCDAGNPTVIQLLRSRKIRPSKPFAVLYPFLEMVRNNFTLDKNEEKLLKSSESPIVLLYPDEKAFPAVNIQHIAPGLNRLGVMLPYSPLLELIANDFGNPLIATSANISGSPIIYKDEDALEYLFEIADYIVRNDREIVIPQDDSVVQFSKHSKQKIILRRSRGSAPSFPAYEPQNKSTVLSTGAFLKSSFTLSINKNVFVSQFLGSGENYESQQMYRHTLDLWLKLYSVKPAVIIADMHPDYFSHRLATELVGEYAADLKFVQHHEAHFAAVLAENNLLHSPEAVLGVVWDGTGLGADGNTWGGEFFKYEANELLRCCYFDYFPAIAGDKMAEQPRIAAFCATGFEWPQSNLLRKKFTGPEWVNYRSLLNNTTLFSSSAGRIFDAVASLLDLCDKQTYEGEAAS